MFVCSPSSVSIIRAFSPSRKFAIARRSACFSSRVLASLISTNGMFAILSSTSCSFFCVWAMAFFASWYTGSSSSSPVRIHRSIILTLASSGTSSRQTTASPS